MKQTKALPAGAASTVTDPIDLKHGSRGDILADCELLLTVPTLATGALPDTKTITYDIIESDNSDLSSPTTVVAAAIVQTGAGGAGATGTTFRHRPRVDGKRYWGVKATGVATVAASGSSMTLELML